MLLVGVILELGVLAALVVGLWFRIRIALVLLEQLVDLRTLRLYHLVHHIVENLQLAMREIPQEGRLSIARWFFFLILIFILFFLAECLEFE